MHTVFRQINVPALINAPQHYLGEYCVLVVGTKPGSGRSDGTSMSVTTYLGSHLPDHMDVDTYET